MTYYIFAYKDVPLSYLYFILGRLQMILSWESYIVNLHNIQLFGYLQFLLEWNNMYIVYVYKKWFQKWYKLYFVDIKSQLRLKI
jgi:hypothetical protein